ncbi:TonB-dependent receptor [Telluria mixta]|uniref:TonB-dependent receptor n=1 Tax=Telluria mixta TaxID=34071 RepID=A0ABT2C1A1_9BURK|nr:TonB-dependent receptor [Telluria mixta]MCS0631165.1 TonB-dependent receptor [Telluria mixta]WEM95703.1 TonB-dependent receptor [Telluria mixta]
MRNDKKTAIMASKRSGNRRPADINLNAVTRGIRSIGFASALVGTGTLLIGSCAHAQSEQQPSAQAISEVVVTGSRVSPGSQSPTPLTAVNADDLLTVKPGSISDAINELPIFAGSRGQNGNPGNGTTNNSGNLQNLRGLGYARTLVLWDGHRLPATTQDQLVDTDMIPQMLLKRVDIVTGGASAVYGSDAVAGVINFVTDTHFTGVKTQVQGGVSTYGDDKTSDIGIAGGKDLFNGKGHVIASYQYRDDPGVPYRTDRPWGTHQWTVQGAGTAANPYRLADNTRIATSSFGGLVRGGPLGGLDFTQNGVLTPFVHGAPTGNANYESGGGGAYYNGSIRGSMRSHQAFARLDYDVSDSVHGYVEGSLTDNRTQNFGAYNALLNGVTLSATNPYLAQNYQNQLAAANAATFNVARVFADAPRINTAGKSDQYFLNGGLNGELANGAKWNIAGTHARARLDTRNDNNWNNQRLAAALDAVVNPATGQVVCRASLTSSAYANCVPLNILGPTAPSQAALGYITQATSFAVTNTLDEIEGTISGAPFSTWAGPVDAALTGQWRKQTYAVATDALPTDKADCSGISFNCTSSTFLYLDPTIAARSKVSQTVKEIAGESDIPLLKNAGFARNLNLNLAARFTDYDTSGRAWTYKAGVDWDVSRELKLRSSYSRDIRAPNLNDLFQPATSNAGSFTDLLTGLSPRVPVTVGGNPDLKPEVGKTFAAGIVIKPAFLPGFNASLDYFNIKVIDAITNIQGTNPSVQATCYASGGTSPYCALQTRPLGFANTSAANAVTSFINTVINIGSMKTRGFDFEANYRTKLLGNPLGLRLLTTYQPSIVYETPGLQTIDVGGVGFSSNALQASARVRGTFFVDYKVGDFSVNASERWRSRLAFTGDPTQIVSSPDAPAIAYTNLNLGWNFSAGAGRKAQLFFNVQNLFNRQPPPIAFLGGNGAVGTFGGFAQGDDPVGRYFTVGLRINL